MNEPGPAIEIHDLVEKFENGRIRALANEPLILLADEPTGRLDSVSGRRVLDLLEDLHHRRGLTVVLVTHDPVVAQRADRIVRMLDGRVVGEEIVRHESGEPPKRLAVT